MGVVVFRLPGSMQYITRLTILPISLKLRSLETTVLSLNKSVLNIAPIQIYTVQTVNDVFPDTFFETDTYRVPSKSQNPKQWQNVLGFDH